ncbi:hypothetical protein [Algoriphagus aquaeductus]|uniref:hypothetical protein n=1 Tax=Algoriphagus aquaeductus TaxID=475299 RepID=UPI00391BF16C
MEAQAKKSGLDPKEPGLTFAAALANGLKNENIREFIFDKTQEQFDGDFNFLYYTEKDQSLGGPNSKSLTFSEAIFGDQSNFRSTESSLEFDPLMQEALRGNDDQLLAMEDIDPNTPVLYISPNQDLKTNPIVPIINSAGEVSEWDIRVVPDQPVLVIGQNERLVKVPKNSNARIAVEEPCLQNATPYFSDGTNDYHFYTDAFCGGGGIGGTPGGGSGGGTLGCDRDLNSNWERLDRVRFTTMEEMRTAESWVDGAPEVYFIVFTGSSQSSLSQIKKAIPEVDRSKWKDCGVFTCTPEWVIPQNLEIFNWDKLSYSQIITYNWFEYDPGDSETDSKEVNYKDPITGLTFKRTETIVTSNNDVDLFGTPVEYCDDATGADARSYTTGKVNFVIRID